VTAVPVTGAAVHAGTDPVAVRVIGHVLAVGGALGTPAALVLAVEKIAPLQDPGYTPTCTAWCSGSS
jgi:hypothetical protein